MMQATSRRTAEEATNLGQQARLNAILDIYSILNLYFFASMTANMIQL
jgi:hypothetical protein